MKRDHRLANGAAALAASTLCILSESPAAFAAETAALPGKELWQPYLDAAPQSAEAFVRDPLGTLWQLLPLHPVRLLAQIAGSYADVFLFLLVLILLSFLAGELRDASLLEVVSAAGCGVLLWGDIAELAQTLCEKMLGWKNFLLGFLPVYGGVLTAGGEINAGAASCGLLLSGLCFLAQCTALWAGPLVQSYLAISMACCISPQKGLSDGCRIVGSLLRKGICWTGHAFAVLISLQRMTAAQLDRTTLQLNKLLTGSVPVIGETLSNVTETVFAGMRLLKNSLGLAGLAALGAEFAPLYLGLLLNLLFLKFCVLLCSVAENRRCEELFSCMAEAVRCMAAVTALFFELALVGIAVLMAVGGG